MSVFSETRHWIELGDEPGAPRVERVSNSWRPAHSWPAAGHEATLSNDEWKAEVGHQGADGVVRWTTVDGAEIEVGGRTVRGRLGPLALKAVRNEYLSAGLSRSEVNRRARAVRRCFRWAASEELIPASVSQALATVEGLRQGRTTAREKEPVRPVDPAHVEATLPFLPKPVAGLVRFQMLTGCRPGEACQARPCDIDAAGAVWVFRPARHKNQLRGKGRAVAVGPQAQAVLREFAPADPTAYYFSPAEAVAAFHTARSAARVTPRYPSHMRRNAAKRAKHPTRPPAERYCTESYGRAIRRAVAAATAAGVAVPEWAPNQLRHTHGTRVRQRYGLEAAQVVLGHSKADVTQVYAEADLTLAAKVAAEIG